MKLLLSLALSSLTAIGCSGASEPCVAGDPSCPGQGTFVSMDFAASGDFYASPFPTDARLTATGGVDLTSFPNPGGNDLVHRISALLTRDARGFGLTSGVFFRLNGPIAEAELPSLAASVTAASPVILVGVDKASPDYLVRIPITTRFFADGGPYGAPNLLAALPLQGRPLRPKTRYAAVVRRGLHDAKGEGLGHSPQMAEILAGTRPEGLSEGAFTSYRAALTALGEAGIEGAEISGLAVFTTDDPEAPFAKVTAAMAAAVPAPSEPFSPAEVFDDYCVYTTTLSMPEYQSGAPPYTESGGDWAFDEVGHPLLQRSEEANFVVTVPRLPMPAAGYPVVVMSRTGGGGERPLVDRGAQATSGGPAIVPGSGPALYFAKAGFAGSSVDGPHGGLRNITHGDEQFLMFNIGNPAALRDNVRQSAAELALQAHVLESITVDVSACPGAVAPGGLARFDTTMMALMGHSMGATIAPLTLAYEPRYRAGLLSGCGGSWIENVIFKEKPLAVKGIAEVLVGLAGSGHELSEHDPVLSLFQWAGEGADPPVFARRIAMEPEGAPRHLLMMQGIVDHYIMPPIANAASLSLGLDLAGEELDDGPAEIKGLAPLGPLLSLSGRAKIALPASLNVTSRGGAKVTAVVTQHAEDGVEDGHEVVFQTEGAKHQYRCFLAGLAKGAPVVPAPGKALDPCE